MVVWRDQIFHNHYCIAFSLDWLLSSYEWMYLGLLGLDRSQQRRRYCIEISLLLQRTSLPDRRFCIWTHIVNITNANTNTNTNYRTHRDRQAYAAFENTRLRSPSEGRRNPPPRICARAIFRNHFTRKLSAIYGTLLHSWYATQSDAECSEVGNASLSYLDWVVMQPNLFSS